MVDDGSADVAGEPASDAPDDTSTDGCRRPANERPSKHELLVAEGDAAGDYLERLLDILDFDGDIDLDVEGERAVVSIIGEGDIDKLVGDHGEVLDALQELTRLAAMAETGQRSRLMLDIAGYRARRRTELGELGRTHRRAGRPNRGAGPAGADEPVRAQGRARRRRARSRASRRRARARSRAGASWSVRSPDRRIATTVRCRARRRSGNVDCDRCEPRSSRAGRRPPRCSVTGLELARTYVRLLATDGVVRGADRSPRAGADLDPARAELRGRRRVSSSRATRVVDVGSGCRAAGHPAGHRASRPAASIWSSRSSAACGSSTTVVAGSQLRNCRVVRGRAEDVRRVSAATPTS